MVKSASAGNLMQIMDAGTAELTGPNRPPRSPRRLFDWGAILVGAVCIVVQLAHLAGAMNDPTFEVPIVDSGVYHDSAIRFAGGQRLADDAFWQPPLFPLALGYLYRLVDPNVLSARIVLASLAVSSCLLIWWIGQCVFSRRVGIIAGLTAALYGPFVFFSTQLLPTGPAVLLDLVALAVLMSCIQQPRWYGWLLFGLLTGLATITVANSGVLFIIGVVGAVASGWVKGDPQRVRACMTACTAMVIGAAIPIGSVTVRNFIVSRELVVLSTNGGMNFYIGNNPRSDETVAIRPGEHWKRLARESYVDGARTRAEQSEYFLRRGLAYAVDQPLDFLRGFGRKTLRLINAREIPRNLDPYVHRDSSYVLRLLLWRAGPFCFPYGLMAPLALLGVIVTFARRTRDHRYAGRTVLFTFIVTYGASIVLFFVTSRYRLPMAMVMILFSSYGAAWAWDQLRDRGRLQTPRRLRLVAMAAFALAVVAVNLPINAPTDGINFRAEEAMSVGHAYTARGDLAKAEEHLRLALELDPEYSAAAAGLADVLMLSDRPDEAETLLRDAVTRDDTSSETRRLLGQILRARGMSGEAISAFEEALRIDSSSPEAHAGLADVLDATGRIDDAIAHYRTAIESIDEPGPLLIRLGDALVQKGDFEEAIERYRQGLWRIEPDEAALNRIAWLLATCPVADLRDCKQAIDIAEHLCRMTEYKHPVAMDTLAAAYAECGRLSDAVTWVQRAIDTALAEGDNNLADSFRPRLRIYEQRLNEQRP